MYIIFVCIILYVFMWRDIIALHEGSYKEEAIFR